MKLASTFLACSFGGTSRHAYTWSGQLSGSTIQGTLELQVEDSGSCSGTMTPVSFVLGRVDLSP